ncbi:8338_t:CDS:2 [Racocetra fulgida]|uniref:V-type proton ATPase subunit G n=1 Tax=Racocetra fulgida TaxID=60492 RepID=A0A9N9BPQ3_9GLOM|nr:8338_t:CDS:2 [Racocetra fulgida]
MLIEKEAAQSSQGIQTLLEAEKEAARIVQGARNYRVQRLKEARTEAIKEIEELKARKNAEFQAFEAEHSGSSDQSFALVEAETESKLVAIKEAFENKKLDVMDKLFHTTDFDNNFTVLIITTPTTKSHGKGQNRYKFRGKQLEKEQQEILSDFCEDIYT